MGETLQFVRAIAVTGLEAAASYCPARPQVVFVGTDDYQRYLSALRESGDEYAVQVYAF